MNHEKWVATITQVLPPHQHVILHVGTDGNDALTKKKLSKQEGTVW